MSECRNIIQHSARVLQIGRRRGRWQRRREQGRGRWRRRCGRWRRRREQRQRRRCEEQKNERGIQQESCKQGDGVCLSEIGVITLPPSLVAKKKMADNDSLSAFLASAVDAAHKAGEIIRKGFYQTKHVEHKGQVDLVTETDKACEELIFNHLKHIYPTHKFIGEETTAAFGTTELTDDPTWIVDPLDGTTNFVHGYPFVCVSIGLTIGKIPTVGVVYNPIINELFTGIRGKGAFLNGNPIKVSSQTELMSSLLATEAGTKRDKLTVDACTKRINSLLFKVRSLRMSGSCAMNLCGIACGRLDVCFELGFGGPWDVAGGAVIVREAGGVIFDPSGADFDITSQRVAASNPFLKDALVDALRQTE